MPLPDLPIDISDATARTLDGRTIYLKQSQVELLKPLIAAFGKLLLWEELIDALWGAEPDRSPVAARSTIQHRLRMLKTMLRDTGLRFRSQHGLGIRLMWWSDGWIDAKRRDLGVSPRRRTRLQTRPSRCPTRRRFVDDH